MYFKGPFKNYMTGGWEHYEIFLSTTGTKKETNTLRQAHGGNAETLHDVGGMSKEPN